jgi:hypothetical protein
MYRLLFLTCVVQPRFGMRLWPRLGFRAWFRTSASAATGRSTDRGMTVTPTSPFMSAQGERFQRIADTGVFARRAARRLTHFMPQVSRPKANATGHPVFDPTIMPPTMRLSCLTLTVTGLRPSIIERHRSDGASSPYIAGVCKMCRILDFCSIASVRKGPNPAIYSPAAGRTMRTSGVAPSSAASAAT